MTILTFYTTQTKLQLYVLWVCRVVRPYTQWLCGIQEYNVSCYTIVLAFGVVQRVYHYLIECNLFSP